MHAKDINTLNLEPGCLDLVDDPADGAGGIGTGEDVFVHEETPDEVFVLPALTDTGDLEEEDAVVVEEVVNVITGPAEARDASVKYCVVFRLRPDDEHSAVIPWRKCRSACVLVASTICRVHRSREPAY